LKRGIDLSLLIEPSFLSIHVSGGYDTDQGPIAPQGKGNVKRTLVCLPQRVKSRFLIAMPWVIDNDQGIVEENAFSLGLTNVMFIGAFTAVAGIPVKTDNLSGVDHCIC
jgi:hypothetical protein